MADFVIPELGENVTGGDVVRILVKPGDTLKKEQPVLELETDKATIEVPSTVAGVVKELKIKTGDKVKVGQLVLTVDEAAQPAAAAAAPTRSARRRAPAAAKAAEVRRRQSRQAAATVVAGRQEPRRARRRRTAAGRRDFRGAGRSAVEGRRDHARRAASGRGRRPPPAQASPAGASHVPAAPSTRRYARELGVDITRRRHRTGRTRVDRRRAHDRAIDHRRAAAAGCAATPLPDFSQWGEVEARRCASSARRPRSGWRRRGPRFRTSPSSTRPTSPSSRSFGRSTRRRPRRRAASSRSPRSP